MDKFISTQAEARLKYLDSDYEIIEPGDFVKCAVCGSPIRLEDLKYWSAELQEAYASADHAFSRAQEKGFL